MKIPVVLPTVHVLVDARGGLTVKVDGRPHDIDRFLTRGDLPRVIRQITTALDTPVRVNVHETDGTTYTDIAAPSQVPPADPHRDPPPEANDPGLTPCPPQGCGIIGDGFQPGEEVAIAYVVARRTAGRDGSAAFTLPPGLMSLKRDGLVLFGTSSHVVTALP